MLEAAPLYPEPSYRQALEATARRNMSEELKRLSEG
jgi:predicted metal-dependent HD superfamily phosphohydrolase